MAFLAVFYMLLLFEQCVCSSSSLCKTELASLSTLCPSTRNIPQECSTSQYEMIITDKTILSSTTDLSCNLTTSVPIVVRCLTSSIVPCRNLEPKGCFGHSHDPIAHKAFNLTIMDCRFLGSLIDYHYCPRCSVKLVNVDVNGGLVNSAYAQKDDMILISGGTDVTLTVINSSFYNASQAIQLYWGFAAHIESVSVKHVHASGVANTGAVHLQFVETIFIHSVSFLHSSNAVGERASLERGGCLSMEGRYITIQMVTFDGCVSSYSGGALGVIPGYDSHVLIQNITISNSRSTFWGGGIVLNLYYLTQVKVLNVTFLNCNSNLGTLMMIMFFTFFNGSNVFVSDVYGEAQLDSKGKCCIAVQQNCEALPECAPGYTVTGNTLRLRNIRVQHCPHVKGPYDVFIEKQFVDVRSTQPLLLDREVGNSTATMSLAEVIGHSPTRSLSLTEQTMGIRRDHGRHDEVLVRNSTMPSDKNEVALILTGVSLTTITAVLSETTTGQSASSLCLLFRAVTRDCGDAHDRGDGYVPITALTDDICFGTDCATKYSLGRLAGSVVVNALIVPLGPLIKMVWVYVRSRRRRKHHEAEKDGHEDGFSVVMARAKEPSKTMWWVVFWSDAVMVSAAYMAYRSGTSSFVYTMVAVIGCCVIGPVVMHAVWFGSVVCYVGRRRSGRLMKHHEQSGCTTSDDDDVIMLPRCAYFARCACSAQYDTTKVRVDRYACVVLGPMTHLMLSLITSAPTPTDAHCRTQTLLIVIIHGLMGLQYGVLRPFVGMSDNVVCCVVSALSCGSLIASQYLGSVEVGLGLVLCQTLIRFVYGMWKRYQMLHQYYMRKKGVER
eukprot:PhF_6_TR27933/c0_g1_i2/m.41141